MFNAWRQIPGPCPVDDTPHTTCTAPTTITSKVQPSQQVTVSIQRPGWLRQPEAPPPAERTVSDEFTTSTYKRSVHGRKRR